MVNFTRKLESVFKQNQMKILKLKINMIDKIKNSIDGPHKA